MSENHAVYRGRKLSGSVLVMLENAPPELIEELTGMHGSVIAAPTFSGSLEECERECAALIKTAVEAENFVAEADPVLFTAIVLKRHAAGKKTGFVQKTGFIDYQLRWM